MAIHTGSANPNELLPHHLSPPRQQKQISYPVNAFPPVIRDVIKTLYEDTQIPIELIGSTVLAAAALALQPVLGVMPPYSSEPEPCSLYVLSMAKSGEGKSTLSRLIMKPFHEFSEMMKKEYDKKLSDYKKEYRIWNVRRKVLEKSFYDAVKHNNYEVEEFLLQDHLDAEPQKPNRFNLIYEDATPKAIIEGLSEYAYAGIISDEAITFFTGYTKNNLGLLNKAWSGDAYTLKRAKEEEIDVKPFLTLSLMVQPGVFFKYLEKHSDIAASSGFLSRFLFSSTQSTIGLRRNNVSNNTSEHAVSELHKKFHSILAHHKDKFYDETIPKKILELSSEARRLFQDKYNTYQGYMVDGQKWSHMCSIGSKAGSNALRIAAIIHGMSNKSDTAIDYETLNKGFSIAEWYLEQADMIFYPMSPEYLFVCDVYELFEWIKNHFANPTKKDYGFGVLDGELKPFDPFPKRDIETNGPYRLRRINKLEPVLRQLIGFGLITIIKYENGKGHFIYPNRLGQYGIIPVGNENKIRFKIVLSSNDVKPKNGRFDMSRFNWS